MASEKVLPPARLAHIVLRTAAGEQFKKMRQFYLDFLGAKVEMENEMLAFLRYDDEHHRIALVGLPGCAKRDRMSAGLEVNFHVIPVYDQDADENYTARCLHL